MSGPKTSRYTLTPEQRRILAEQRRIQRETQKNIILLKENRETIKESLVQINSKIEQYERILAEKGDAGTTLTQTKRIRDMALAAYNSAGSVLEKQELSSLESSNSELKMLQNELGSLTKKLSTALEKADTAFRAEMNTAISEGFFISFSYISENTTCDISEYTHKIDAAVNEIREMTISTELAHKFEILKAKAAEIESVDFIENFYAMSIIPFLKECKAYNSAYKEYGVKFDDVYAEYKTLTKELGLPQELYSFSVENINQLQELVQEMQKSIQHKEEQAYISRCVDSAMKEMGYKMVGERHIAKKNGQKFTNELFLFDEGTAVNVTYSSDGQITMELGGLDNQDRLPDETESQSLAEDMQTFCTDYLEIEKKLKEMGVITHRVSILPADAQFAQIINTSDYDMKQNVDKYEARTKRRSAIGQQQMRKGE